MIRLPDIRQLRVFIALEETRSFTATAGVLNITQSAVSHSLKSLELMLECKLIERLGKTCILTPHGEVFHHHAKEAVKQLEGAVGKIKTLNEWGYSSLRVGVSHSHSQYVLPMVLSDFYDTEKRCEVFVTTGDTRLLLDKLNKGELDIVFGIRTSKLESEYQFRSVAEDSLCFITHSSHEWVSRKPENTEDYEKERFIVYGSNSITAGILASHLSGLGIRSKASTFVSNMESIKAMVANNIGVGIVAEWTVRKEIDTGELITHAIHPSPVREWGCYLSNTKSLTLAEGKFIDLFSDELRKVIKGV